MKPRAGDDGIRFMVEETQDEDRPEILAPEAACTAPPRLGCRGPLLETWLLLLFNIRLGLLLAGTAKSYFVRLV